MTPARRDPRGVLHLGGAAGALAAAPVAWELIPWLEPDANTGILLVLLGGILCAGSVWALLALRLLGRRVVQTVTVGPGAVEVVGSPTSPVHVRRVPIERIASIEPPWSRLPGFVLFPQGWAFPVAIGGKGADPEVLAAVSDRIRGRVGALPDGPARLAGIDARARAVSALAGRVPVATLALQLLVILSFLVQWMSCVPLRESCPAMAWANAPDRVAAGEVYRLVSANLLHANLTHFAFNLVSLAAFGSFAELALGWRRAALLYAACAVGAQAVAAAWGGATVVGASGIAYGALGALLWLHLRRRDELPGRLRAVHVLWLQVGLGLLVELAIPRISSATHLGGFVTGFAITPLLVGRCPLFDLPRRR